MGSIADVRVSPHTRILGRVTAAAIVAAIFFAFGPLGLWVSLAVLMGVYLGSRYGKGSWFG